MSSHADKRAVIAERSRILGLFPGQKVPAPTQEVLKQADEIAGGTFMFCGDVPVRIGTAKIDWSGAQLKHQEFPAQLNRFYLLGPLAAAFQHTQREEYALAARAFMQDWMDHGGSYESGEALRPGDSTLNISIRLGTSQHAGWGGMLPVFLNSKPFDDAFLERLLASLSAQAEYLKRHLAGWGNWRISQLDALVFTTLRFPFLENAAALQRFGMTGMRNGLATQFLPDGVHIERSPSYASWMTSVAFNYWRVARLFPEADAAVDAVRLAKAFDYLAQSALAGVNDSYIALREPDNLPELEERRQALAELFPGQAVEPPPLAQVFPAAGQVFARSAWQAGGDQLAFDASTWGGDHTHLSRLALAFRSGGRLLVADPGILTYERTDPFAAYGKSTAAHSTLNVNGGNQSEADALLARTEITPRTVFIKAQYQGAYWEGRHVWGFDGGHLRGTFGLHGRVVFWVRGEYLLVLDEMFTDNENTVQNVWQLGPMDGWKSNSADCSWWSTNPDSNLLLRMISHPPQTTMEVFAGRTQPRAGWVGHHGHDARPAPQVRFRYPASGYKAHPAASAVLLAPFKGAARPDYQVAAVHGATDKNYHTVELVLPDGARDLVSWTRCLEVPIEGPQAGGRLTTDAPFVWLRADRAGRPARVFMLDGTYLTYDGKCLCDGLPRQANLVTIPGGG